MAKKIMYECDICHRTVDRSYIRTFFRLAFATWRGHDLDKFHICINCLSVWRVLAQTGIENWKDVDVTKYYEEYDY